MLSRPKSAKFDKTIDKIDKVCYNGIIGPEKGEYFDVLDSNGHKTGRIKLRSEVHRDGDWHRAVNIWIVNGGVLLQRRSLNKDSYPGLWDISCGGHLTTGDDSLAAAVRELSEELGVIVSSDALQYLTTWRSSTRPAPDFINNSFNDLYLLRTELSLSDFTMQLEEICDLKYFSIPELRCMVDTHDPTLVPHSEAYTQLFRLFGD